MKTKHAAACILVSTLDPDGSNFVANVANGLPWFTNLYTHVYKESKDVAFRTESCPRLQHKSNHTSTFLKLSIESLPSATFRQGTRTHLSPFRMIQRSNMFEFVSNHFKPVLLSFGPKRICQDGFAHLNCCGLSVQQMVDILQYISHVLTYMYYISSQLALHVCYSQVTCSISEDVVPAAGRRLSLVRICLTDRFRRSVKISRQ